MENKNSKKRKKKKKEFYSDEFPLAKTINKMSFIIISVCLG